MDLTSKIINNQYKIIQKISEGGLSSVWLGEDISGSQKVAIKVLKKNAVSHRVEDIIRFRNEADIISKLEDSAVAKILDIGKTGDMHYIVMEYIEGKSLQVLMEENTTFSIEETVDILYKAGQVLQQVHDSNIIHRDLKPGNIILNRKEGEGKTSWKVTLIDFGLSQIKEFDTKDPDQVVGTLSYAAPEQIGAIKRNVDERSDLYSLGILFYQLFTRNLPFMGDSLNSIVHQHIAKVPENLRKYNPFISGTLESIVLKLLEKEPERRYQSVQGLLKDLEKYRKGQEGFALGLNDTHVKLDYKTLLTGREEELSKLKDLLHYAREGRGSICFLYGEAGSGKTRLVEELKNNRSERKCVFIHGKCFSGKSKMPYGPFKDALNEYLREFDRQYSQEQKDRIKQNLQKDIGNLGEIILRLNPLMDEIIGSCPPLVELEPLKENSRFLSVSSQFFFNLAKEGDPLILVLDDLHWADEGSLDLVAELAKGIEKYPILVIGTFRNDEVHEEHGLGRLIKKLLKNGYPLEQIEVEPFDGTRMNAFIAGLLYDTLLNTREIARFILQKSKGNPFFAIEILKQLINENAIYYMMDHWEMDKDQLDQIQVSPTIVDTIIRKTALLDDTEITILSYAAVIGRKFDVQVLLCTGEADKKSIVRAMDRAIELQFLEEDPEDRGKVQFVHDRIKEAFYHYLSGERKRELHEKVGNVMEALYIEDKDRVVFDLVYHYTEGGNREKMLQYAYPAAVKARSNYANEEAAHYLTVAKELLEEKHQSKSQQWILCTEQLGECYYYLGKSGEAVHVFNRLLPALKDPLKKAKIYRLISNAYYKMGNWEKSEEMCKLGLSALNEKLPSNAIQVKISILKEKAVHLWHTLFQRKYMRAQQGSGSEEAKETIWLYYVLSSSYSMKGSAKLLRTVLRMMNLSEKRIGKSKELGLSMMIYALFLAEIPQFKKADQYYQKVFSLEEELNDEWGMAQCYVNMAYFYKCKGDCEKSIRFFHKNISILERIGDTGDLGASLSGLAGVYLYISDYQRAQEYNYKFYELAHDLKSDFGYILVWMHEALYLTEKGSLEDAVCSGIKALELSRKNKELYLCCITGIALGRAYLEKGETENAKKYLEESKDLFEHNGFLKEYSVPVYPYLAECYLAEYYQNRASMSERDIGEVLKKIDRACKNALDNTRQWITSHVCSLRVYAKYNEVVENMNRAEGLFLESIKKCRNMGRKYELGVSLYEYGLFIMHLGKLEKSRQNLESAYCIFKEIGAKGYEKKTAELLGVRREDISPSERFTKEIRYNQRLSSMIALTQNISSILSLDELLKKVISIAMEVSGAQRGYLMLKDQKTGRVEIKAQKNINPGKEKKEDFSKNIVDQVFRTGEAIVTINAMEDEKYNSYESIIYNELKSILCIPIKYNQEIEGVCYLDNPLSSAVFTEEDIDILNVIMGQAAISIENARLYLLAVSDGMTGLFTHKHFQHLLDKEIERSKRYEKVFSVILLDIDDFKKFNDTYGHQAGDQVLLHVAKVARNCFRTADSIARYGGEEFAVLLPEVDYRGALIAAERFRNAIEQMEVLHNGNQLKVTVSCGLASCPHHSTEGQSLIKAADDALYISKRSGKNRTTVFAEGNSEHGGVPVKIKNGKERDAR